MLFLFSLYSDCIFGKIAPCQLLRLKFKNKSDFLSYDFSFKLSAITRFFSSRVALRELDLERKLCHLLTSLSFQCVNPAVIKYASRDFVLLEVSFTVLHTKLAGFTH